MTIKSIIILLLLGIFIIVCIQNLENIQLHLLFWNFEISKLLLLLITLVIGIVTGMIIPGLFQKSKKEEGLEKK